MFYTIYKTINKINNKFYVGKHQTENINDNYYGSGIALENAIKKYGKDSFIKEILFVFDNEIEMNEKEKEIVTLDFIKSKNTYNTGLGGEGGPHFSGRKHSAETKLKISEKRKLQTCSEETKLKLSKALSGRVFSEETKLKFSEAARNRSSEVRQAVSKKLKGTKHSDLTKSKMAESQQKRDRTTINEIAANKKRSESIKKYWQNKNMRRWRNSISKGS